MLLKQKISMFRPFSGEQFIFSLFIVLIMSNSKLVYSTDKTLTNLDESVDVVSVRASEQKVRLHLDRKKGSKVVTLIKGQWKKKIL